MAKQTINVGVTPNDGTGSTIRVGGQVINNNFDDIYNLFGDGSTINFDIGSPTNGQAIVYNSSTGNWEPGTSLVNSDFIVSGDSGSDQTISSNNTLTIAGGTGIDTVASLTDTLTISIDSSVVTPSSTHTLTNKTFDANGTGNSISNIEVADLASGVLDTDLTTVAGTDTTLASAKAIKTYVDNIAAAGIHYHTPVRVESPSNLNASYDNGTSGVGATLTNTGTLAAISIDGVALNLNDRVLIDTQTNAAHNGIYYVSTVGDGATAWVLTRATDADSFGASDPDALGEGDSFFVQEGDTGAGEINVMNTNGTITFGTTNITFAVFADVAVYSAGTGLTLTGTEFSVTSGSIGATQLTNSTISISDSSSSSTSIPLGGGFSVLGGTGISSVVNGSELTLNLSGIDATSIADGSVSNTEFQHLGSVTSDIQTQLDNNRKRALAYAIIF